MKKKEKKIMDVYDPVIYPRRLVVTKNITLQDLRKRYKSRSGNELSDDFNPEKYTYTYNAMDIKTNEFIVLVNIGYKQKEMCEYINDIAHEAEHVKCSIFDDIGLPNTTDSQEADAYLVGWATKCIYKTLIKK